MHLRQPFCFKATPESMSHLAPQTGLNRGASYRSGARAPSAAVSAPVGQSRGRTVLPGGVDLCPPPSEWSAL